MDDTYQKQIVPASELAERLARLRARLDARAPEWRVAAIMGRINVFYLTGVVQNGLLLIERDGGATYWVRKSIQRALEESRFPDIRPMSSFRDAAAGWTRTSDTVLVETQVLTLAHYELFNKYFGFSNVKALDPHIAYVRSIKSAYELERVRRSGTIHRRVLEDRLPGLLREGISEAELGADLMRALIIEGHFGVSRVAAFNAELFLGHVCFGDNSVCGNPFSGPGGVRGFGPAMPNCGNHHRLLRRGDLISVDVGCNVEGYHTDKTVTLCYDAPWPEEAAALHQACLDIERRAAGQLRPGVAPSAIYADALEHLPEHTRRAFMGIGAEQVKFLGHGVGLEIDETPVLAKGFDAPLEEGMVIALEPKIWIERLGMVGCENTYLVTPEGGKCLTAACGA